MRRVDVDAMLEQVVSSMHRGNEGKAQATFNIQAIQALALLKLAYEVEKLVELKEGK